MSDSTTLQPGQSIGGGRFTLTRTLGRGGMGVVWLGQDTRLGEEVALKFLPPEVAADAVALNDLRRETARSHRLTHQNIVRIHDLHEQSDGVAFISMQFVDCPTLSAWRLEQAGQVLTWEQLAPLVQQLCAALDYAHGENVIHRDLKPANVMLDGKGRVKLADFGIAAVVSDSASRVSMVGTSGTLAYMSPQQLTGKRPTVTDDIYALGATLYELLTGKPPFYTGDLTHQVLHEPPEPVEERLAAMGIQNAVPGDVAALIMACLAKDPAQRPQSAAAVAEWIGLTVAQRPATQSLAAGVFAEAGTAPAEAPAAGASNRKLVRACVTFAGVLLLAAGGWFLAHRNSAPKHSNTLTGQPTPERANTTAPGEPLASATEKPPVTSASSADSETGFVSLFNGRDLAGWDGDPAVWSVKDGDINARATTPKSSLLIRRDLVVSDFELRLSCRLVGDTASSAVAGNIGVRFRCHMDATPAVTGYQTDFGLNAQWNREIFGGAPRGILAKTGQKVLAQGGGANGTVQVIGSVSTPDEIEAVFKPNDWNELTIVAQGNHLIYKINGLVAAELIDEDEAHRSTSGQLALKLWFNKGPVAAAQIKDIRFKQLKQETAASRSTSLDAEDSAIVPEAKEFVYKQTPQGPLKLYVHYPSGWKSSDHRPAAVFFFGGGWKSGSVEEVKPQAEYLASRGMVAARADYRVLSRHKTTPDKSVEDAKSAIRWLRSNASQLGIDPEQIVAAGSSAGGHLAAATALIPGFSDSSDDQRVSCRPNALVLYNPVLSHNVNGLEVTNSAGKNIAKEFWPTLFLSKQAPPTILFYGTSDAHIAQGRDYCTKAKPLGVRTEFFVAANQSHGFFHRPPWDELTLIETDRFLTSQGYLKGEPKVKVPVGTEAKLQREL